MSSPTIANTVQEKNLPQLWKSEILRGLTPVATRAVNAQLAAFSTRLTDALLALSLQNVDAKTAYLSAHASNLLKNNAYAFQHLASAGLEKILQNEINAIEDSFTFNLKKCDGDLSLVSYEEMDNKVLISTISRPLEMAISDQLAALNIRIASVLNRESITTAQNPFRPAVFLAVMQQTWCEFNPDVESHPLVLPLFRPDVFIDLAPVVAVLNDALIAKNIVPGSVESYRIKKTEGNNPVSKKEPVAQAALSEQLRRIFSPPETRLSQAPMTTSGVSPVDMSNYALATAASSQLFSYLAQCQTRMSFQGGSVEPATHNHNAVFLPSIKSQAPKGTFSQVDEHAIDLLSTIFESVFVDQHIPNEIKKLIGILQVPVLKAALIDKEFFFKEEHPARRLIELLTAASIGWNPKKGQDDPLFQLIKSNVDRVEREFDQEISLFSDVISDLESYVKKEDDESAKVLSEPISKALKQENFIQATKCAKEEITVRIGTGEVVAFVETFLEKKWVSVLTIAYRLKEDKPQALESAIKTMDDLIWSVKPKITMQERKDLISKLPSMLAMLNKWINVVKWADADRLQFFAELAECHASIVRAPIELSPERQLEIAISVAKKSAERRLEKRANPVPEPVADDSVLTVEGLQRGMWLEFLQKDDVAKKVKLAWVSPLRSLYIFTTTDKQEAFSLSAEDLAQTFRENRVQVVVVDGFVNRALTKALKDGAVNDENMSQAASA